jgi:RHS repeat-associated protein
MINETISTRGLCPKTASGQSSPRGNAQGPLSIRHGRVRKSALANGLNGSVERSLHQPSLRRFAHLLWPRTQPMHFTGKERDSESGLDNFGARYYGSSMGRFTSGDPSSASIDKTNPQSWNRYTYTYNNPLAFVDHNGKWPTKIHEQIIDKAFPGLSSRQRQVLKDASSYVDRIRRADKSP